MKIRRSQIAANDKPLGLRINLLRFRWLHRPFFKLRLNHLFYRYPGENSNTTPSTVYESTVVHHHNHYSNSRQVLNRTPVTKLTLLQQHRPISLKSNPFIASPVSYAARSGDANEAGIAVRTAATERSVDPINQSFKISTDKISPVASSRIGDETHSDKGGHPAFGWRARTALTIDSPSSIWRSQFGQAYLHDTRNRLPTHIYGSVPKSSLMPAQINQSDETTTEENLPFTSAAKRLRRIYHAPSENLLANDNDLVAGVGVVEKPPAQFSRQISVTDPHSTDDSYPTLEFRYATKTARKTQSRANYSEESGDEATEIKSALHQRNLSKRLNESPVINIEQLSDQVMRVINKRLRVERQRSGIG